MKETGIIMSGNHPKLILDELKAMTRRLWGLKEINENPDVWEFMRVQADGTFLFWKKSEYASSKFQDPENVRLIKCPYGQVGDRLWVKETWASENRYNHLKPSEIPQRKSILHYLAGGYSPFEMGRVRPSIFMPRWASRITLEITEVRAERLQEITDKDAIAEGISPMNERPSIAFGHHWDSLNAKRGYGFDFNPWVFPLGFKKMK